LTLPAAELWCRQQISIDRRTGLLQTSYTSMPLSMDGTDRQTDRQTLEAVSVNNLQALYMERECAENYNKWHNKIVFLNCNQHLGNFKP